MKILFLDIDGVLNTIESLNSAKSNTTDPLPEEYEVIQITSQPYLATLALRSIIPELVSNLNTLVDSLNIDGIVIHSNWRKTFSLYFIKAVLEYHGLKGKVIGETPHHFDGQMFSEQQSKGKEIKDWLDNHSDVDFYIILDDENIFHGMKRLYNFFQINPLKGLTSITVETIKTNLVRME